MSECGVHPEGGAGEAGVAEAADGEDGAAGFGEGGVDVPAEAAEVLTLDGGVGVARGAGRIDAPTAMAVLLRRWLAALSSDERCCAIVAGLLGLGHELQRGLLEREGAGVVEEFVEQGLGEEGDVVGGGEEAGVAGDSAHAAGGGVVDCAAE